MTFQNPYGKSVQANSCQCLNIFKKDQMDKNTYSHFTHGARVVIVRGNDDVDVFYNTLEGLVQVLSFQLKFKKSTVHLVHEHNRLDTLSNSLTKHSLSLNTHTCQENIVRQQEFKITNSPCQCLDSLTSNESDLDCTITSFRAKYIAYE